MSEQVDIESETHSDEGVSRVVDRQPQSSEVTDDLIQRRRDNFEYDIDLEDEDSHASAAQLALLEKRNKKLMDQIEELEDKVFDSEELCSTLRRKLALFEEESIDFKNLTKQRNETHLNLTKQLQQLNTVLHEEFENRTKIETERRQLEHKIVLLETEAQQHQRAQSHLQQANNEVDNLRMKIDTVVAQKADLSQTMFDLERRKVDLENKLSNKAKMTEEESTKSQQHFNNLIDHERKRGQEAIDYVRRTLNSKIRFLELQLEEIRENEANYRKDIRKLESQLKSTLRSLDEERVQATRSSRKLETLQRQINQIQEKNERILIENNSLETENYNIQSLIDSTTAQYDAALYVNERLNAELPVTSRLEIEDKDEEKKKQAPSSSSSSSSSSGAAKEDGDDGKSVGSDDHKQEEQQQQD
eukprot:TRINITY_DN597_c0_g1_i1.p1 TRINITY_DN597_c0_g1~~TRINITY_DN597_c0_g1_i1.p1  ORF type:complete len:417 (+),score=164.23 TRINITY_DN597_c0_g1_i1:73-1323(+)